MIKNRTWFQFVHTALIVLIGLSTMLNVLGVKAAHANMMADPSMQNNVDLAGLADLAAQGITEQTISQAWVIIAPRGVPAVYGDALGISFDDVEGSMNVMRQYDPNKDVSLMTPDILGRYTQIGLMISCEYCCAAKTMVFDNGMAACGCAHAKAMRGLVRYLLEGYPDMTDSEILAELVKWKSLYFPRDASTMALELVNQGTLDMNTYLINNVK